MIIFLTATSIILLLSSLWLALGQHIVQLIRIQLSSAMRLSLSYLLGFTVFIYGMMLLGLCGQFTRPVIISSLGLMIALLHRTILSQWLWLYRRLRYAVLQLPHYPKWQLGLAVIIGLMLFANYLACFAPPVARDAISYHLPEANLIVSTHTITFPLGGHWFYGNIPVFMEIAYAFGIILTGYSLANLLHYFILLSFLGFIYGWLKNHYNTTTALWGVLGILSLNHIVETGTSTLVDTAFMSCEIIGLLLILDWRTTKNIRLLLLSGMILGLAISVKYSPLFTVAVMLLTITVQLLLDKAGTKTWLRSVSTFSVGVLVVGGFWYIKNLLLFHNPTYPLLFGHNGVDATQYASLIAAIQDFVVPRTLWNYLRIPIIFYSTWMNSDQPLLSLAYDPQTIVVWLGFLSLPWLLFIKKHRTNLVLLLGYCVLFSINWFFVSTHQDRFLDTATIVLVLIATISVTQAPRLGKKIWIGMVILLAVSIGIYFRIDQYSPVNLAYVSLAKHGLRADEVNVVLGRTTKAQYLSQWLDCGYTVASYLEDNQLTGAVLDNWSAWHNSQYLFYVTHNRYFSLPPNLSAEATFSFIKQSGIHYIYFNQTSKADFSTTDESIAAQYYAARIDQETSLLQNASLVYTVDSCQLYRLTW